MDQPPAAPLAQLPKARAAAVSALSASLFVRPDLHDGYRATQLFLQLRACDGVLGGTAQQPATATGRNAD